MKSLKFFLLVFALSIPLWVIETIIDVKRSSLDFSVTDILAAFTPIISACFLIYKEEGRTGISKLFQRILDFARITKKVWYIAIIFLPFSLYFLIYIIIRLAGLPLSYNIDIPFKSIPFLFILFFIGNIVKKLVIWVMQLTLCRNTSAHYLQVYFWAYPGQYGITRQ